MTALAYRAGTLGNALHVALVVWKVIWKLRLALMCLA